MVGKQDAAFQAMIAEHQNLSSQGKLAVCEQRTHQRGLTRRHQGVKFCGIAWSVAIDVASRSLVIEKNEIAEMTKTVEKSGPVAVQPVAPHRLEFYKHEFCDLNLSKNSSRMEFDTVSTGYSSHTTDDDRPVCET